MKIVVTGGHITPALAFIEEFRQQLPGAEIVVIGRKYAIEGSKTYSEEVDLVKKLGLQFLPLTAGRLTRVLSFNSFLAFLKIPIGFIQAFIYIWQVHPRVVVSFGGYIALPVVVAAKIFGVRSVTHEQAAVPGLTNQIISHLTDRVCVSFTSSIKYFPGDKAVHTGLPIRSQVLHVDGYDYLETNRKLIYITGGSTGSQSINQLVYRVLPELLVTYAVLHQVGKNWISEARNIKSKLAPPLQKYYQVVPYLEAVDHSRALHQAYLLISRAGANTTLEAESLAKVVLFIPLPWSGAGEQLANARYLQEVGSAATLLQDEATPEKLLVTIKNIVDHYSVYAAAARRQAEKTTLNGAEKLVRIVRELV